MKKRLYVDMDGVLVNFKSGIDKLPEDVKKQYEGHLDDVPGIFSLMDPIPGALEAYRKLSEIYDTYILSTAPWENSSAWSDKNEWVRKHLGDVAHKRLILTHNKDFNMGDYLIDDRTKWGAGTFKGELIHFETEKFPDWKTVLKYLIKEE
jgi:5'(3')-deoxyribonucleotidase